MKNRSFSILMVLLVALPFMACSLPPDSLNGSQQVPQQKRGHKGMEVTSGEYKSLFDVQFSPDGTLLAIATDIGILLYGTKTYDKPEILIGHTGPIWGIAFRPDGKVLASGGSDKTVRLWDVNTRQHIRTFGIDLYHETNIVFSPDGKMLASGGGSDERYSNVYLWDADTGKSLRTFSGHTGAVYDVAFSPDGKVLASANGGLTVRLWNVSTGQQIRTLTEQIRIETPSGHVRRCWSVAFSPDGNMLVSAGGFRNTVGMWDVNTGQQIRLLTINDYLKQQLTAVNGIVPSFIVGSEVAFSPDGNTIACTGPASVHLWDTDSGQYHRILYNEQDSPIGASDVAFSPDGSTIAYTGWQGVQVWDVKTEKLIRVLISRY